MTTLPNMGIDLPVLGGDSGTWDDKINAGFGLIDAHDHSAGKGVTVKTAGISINADLPFGGFGATGLKLVAFNAVAALSSGSKSLFVNTADNELYWRSQAGVNVKLTLGASINTSLVGGIGGDYSSVGAVVAYDDANKRYTFKTQTGTWARLATGPVRIYEYNTTESVYVEHAVDAALAASYTVTWPAALPAAGRIVQIDAAGLITYSNSLVETLSLAANKNISLQGTGVVGHDEYGISDVAAYRCVSVPGSVVVTANGPTPYISVVAGQQANIHGAPLPAGDRIVAMKITGSGTGASTAPTITVDRTNSDGTTTNMPVTSVIAGVVTGAWEYTLTVTTPLVMGEGAAPVVRYTPAGATAIVYTITTKYDRIA